MAAITTLTSITALGIPMFWGLHVTRSPKRHHISDHREYISYDASVIMVSTRSKNGEDKSSDTGDKRSASTATSPRGTKKQKTDTETNAKLEVGEGGEVGLNTGTKDIEDQDQGQTVKQSGKDENEQEGLKAGEKMEQSRKEMKAEEGEKAAKGEDEVDQKALQGIEGELDEPKHGLSY